MLYVPFHKCSHPVLPLFTSLLTPLFTPFIGTSEAQSGGSTSKLDAKAHASSPGASSVDPETAKLQLVLAQLVQLLRHEALTTYRLQVRVLYPGRVRPRG